MAIDRFIRWKKNIPTFVEIRTVLEDYLEHALHTLSVDVEGNCYRITARLHGHPTFPFRRLPAMEKYAPSVEQRKQRWFEVYVDPKYIDIITRQTDEYTNAVAEGFAELCRRYWKGKRDPG